MEMISANVARNVAENAFKESIDIALKDINERIRVDSELGNLVTVYSTTHLKKEAINEIVDQLEKNGFVVVRTTSGITIFW